MSYEQDLRDELDACPKGSAGWTQFENICVRILSHLFVPPLNPATTQARTLSGVQRRDVMFPNRNLDTSSNNWGKLYVELGARMILFEFKNYSREKVKRDEVNQTRSYMRRGMGRLAFIVCTKKPHISAYRERLTIYNESQIAILFITKEKLKDMLFMKERGEEPSDLIFDLLEELYIQQE